MPKRGRKSKIVEELDCLVSNSVNSADESQIDIVDDRLGSESISMPPSKRSRTDEFRVEEPICSSLEELATALTLPTFLVVYQACKFVPHSFLKRREAIIENILKAAKVSLGESKLSSAIKAIDHNKESLHVGAPPADILWEATNETGMPHLRFLGPPAVSCYQCHSPLCANNSPTSIVFYSQDGPIPASKIILRCTRCKLNYHPEMFGNGEEGYRYYDRIQPIVKCTQQAYMERHLCSMIASAGYVQSDTVYYARKILQYNELNIFVVIIIIIVTLFRHHAWTSFESWAEIYNEVHRGSTTSRQTTDFFSRHPLLEALGGISHNIIIVT